MIILKFLLYFFISLISKKKRYLILNPSLLYLFIKSVFIYDKHKKCFFVQKIQGYGDYITVLEIFFNNDYDVKKFNFWQKINQNNKTHKVPLIIDCGANIGCSSYFFHKNHPNSYIVSIEPEKKNYYLLKENTKSIENIKILNSAISSTEHAYRLQKSFDNRAHKVFKLKNKNSKQMKTITVNKIIKKFSIKKYDLFIIKIDIEGFEKELFKKNCDWMDKFKIIIVELHDWMIPFSKQSYYFQKSIFNSKKFKDVIISGENLILVNY